MKFPESTATVRSARMMSSRAIDKVRGSIRSGSVTGSKGMSRQRPSQRDLGAAVAAALVAVAWRALG
jgi:hypothetical protein